MSDTKADTKADAKADPKAEKKEPTAMPSPSPSPSPKADEATPKADPKADAKSAPAPADLPGPTDDLPTGTRAVQASDLAAWVADKDDPDKRARAVALLRRCGAMVHKPAPNKHGTPGRVYWYDEGEQAIKSRRTDETPSIETE